MSAEEVKADAQDSHPPLLPALTAAIAVSAVEPLLDSSGAGTVTPPST